MSVSPANIHGHIINCMKALGYKPCEKGMCYGLSNIAMVSALQGKEENFNFLLKVLEQTKTDELSSKIADVEKK